MLSRILEERDLNLLAIKRLKMKLVRIFLLRKKSNKKLKK
jgi:hypothetical protein